MAKREISWSKLDAAIRKCHEFVIEAHRHVRNGCPTEGLHDGTNTRVAAINLKKYLEEIIETGK